jgi:sugar porter (SP) family MFS transporter
LDSPQPFRSEQLNIPEATVAKPPLSEVSSPAKKSSVFVYLAALVAAIGTFNWSYSIILMSGSILYLKGYFHIGQISIAIFSHPLSSSWIEGLTMTTGLVGTVAGMLFGGHLADVSGRRRTLLLAAFVMLLGAVGSSLSHTLLLWYFFRLLGGLGGGLALLVGPMYVAELAPPRIRGSLVTFNEMGIVLGAFFANLICFSIAKIIGSNPECWRWMFASGCFFLLIFLAGLFFVPETPRWLMMKGRHQEASDVLSRIGGSDYALTTLRDINQQDQVTTARLREFFRPGVRKAMLISVGLAVFDQWVGVPTLILYAPTLFVKAGVASNASAIGNTVLIRICDIFCCLFAILWVDRFGRRPLLLAGLIAIALGQFLMGVCFLNNLNPLLILLTFFLCEGAFNATLPPVGWLVASEIFPTHLRARGMAIHGAFRFGSSLVLVQVFPYMLEFFRKHFGAESGIFWFFSVVCLAGFVFSYFLVPETKGQTLEAISAGFRDSTTEGKLAGSTK